MKTGIARHLSASFSMRKGFLFWHKIFLLLIFTVISLTLGIGFATWHFLNQASREIGHNSEDILSDQTETYLEKLVKGQAATLDVQLAQAQSAARYGAIFLGEHLGHHGEADIPIEELLANLCAHVTHCTSGYFVTPSGTLRFSLSGLQPSELPDDFDMTRAAFFPLAEILMKEKKEGVVWSQVHVNPLVLNFDLVVDAVSPVHSLIKGEDKIYGYVGISVSLTRLMSQLNQYQPVRGSYTFLIDIWRQLIAAPPHARVELSPGSFLSRDRIDLSHTRNPELDTVLQKMVLGESAISKVIINNEPKYLAYHPLRNINWFLGLVIPIRMATAASGHLINVVESGTRRALSGMIYWACGFLMLALVVGMMLVHEITAPMREMASVAESIAKGNFGERVDHSGNDEMGALGVAFNAMADKIQMMVADLNQKNQELIDEIYERKRAEAALKKSEEQFRSLSESSPDIIFTLAHDGTFAYLNPAFEKILAYDRDAALGKYFTDFILREDISKYTEVFNDIQKEKDAVRNLILRLIHKNGNTCFFSVSSAPNVDMAGKITGMVGICKDITEQRQMEIQLRQAQKMEALGTLAGGIAHDFNNILAAILGYTELARMKQPQESLAIADLDKVLKAVDRAKRLVMQILTFSRQGEQEKEALQLSVIIKEALKLLRASIPSTIEIRQHINQHTPDTVLADPTQIHQVLMNLCTNAAHAMRGKGGRLDVSLTHLYLDKESAAQLSEKLPTGYYVRLTVKDSGQGIEPAILQRIFDPFFTTKGIGEGTGMGLSVVHGVAKSHGGAVSVESELGKGSRFHVYLPLHETEITDSYDESEIPDPLFGEYERILFIDDEKDVVQAFKGMLTHIRYQVTTRTDSLEALALLKASPEQFDIVITDQTMPNMTGSELAKVFMQIKPDMPFILCTGSSEHMMREDAIKAGFREFLMKPVAIQDLARAIRRILHEQHEKKW